MGINEFPQVIRKTESEPPRDEDFDNIALQILCRVFDDGADVAMEEWLAYDKAKWLSPERALGGFIRSRLDRSAGDLRAAIDAATAPHNEKEASNG